MQVGRGRRPGMARCPGGGVRVLHRSDGLREVDAGVAVRLHPVGRRPSRAAVHQPGPGGGGHHLLAARVWSVRPSRWDPISTSGPTWSASSPPVSGSTTSSATRRSSTSRSRSTSWPGSSTSSDVDVFAVGILTDFRTLLFPGSARLVELADRIETLQVRSLCWCGKRATHNARTVDGRMVTEGAQVVVGDTVPTSTEPFSAEAAVSYEVLCRRPPPPRHHPCRGGGERDRPAAVRTSR